MDLYIKWKLRQIYKRFYTILIPLLFQFLQPLEQVCIFFSWWIWKQNEN